MKFILLLNLKLNLSIFNMETMFWDKKNQEYICSQCQSHNVFCKCGMMADLYICNDCGFESRDLKEI